ncbi:MAG: hypothetical protein M3N57_07445, partial [Actinomycetota bacterium]|nr:hypothetical protein [Actinomycetota bacterium]
MSTPRVARVAVEVAPIHLDRLFDYRVGPDVAVQVGSRVEVVFAGRRVRGLVVELTQATDVAPERLRDVRRVLGAHAWVAAEELAVLRWAAERFAAPLADVVRHALPDRVVDVEHRAGSAGWYPPGAAPRPADPPPRSPDTAAWELYAQVGRALHAAAAAGGGAFYWRPLPSEDLGARLTELAGATLAGGRDVLLVVAEPVSAAADAVVAAFPDVTVDVRGASGARRTYRGWLAGRCGAARVVVGERRVAFWPVDRLGLAVVVDESNPALKERRSPRHHAREVALERARRAGAVALLIGTVPSAASWRLLSERRLTPVVPARGAERAAAPVVHVDDRSDPRSRGRLGTPALTALRRAVADGRYGVVLAARRGEGRALVCTACGARLACPRCDSSLAADHRGVACEGCG